MLLICLVMMCGVMGQPAAGDECYNGTFILLNGNVTDKMISIEDCDKARKEKQSPEKDDDE